MRHLIIMLAVLMLAGLAWLERVRIADFADVLIAEAKVLRDTPKLAAAAAAHEQRVHAAKTRLEADLALWLEAAGEPLERRSFYVGSAFTVTLVYEEAEVVFEFRGQQWELVEPK